MKSTVFFVFIEIVMVIAVIAVYVCFFIQNYICN